MAKDYEKQYKIIKSIAEFIRGKASGILISGVFAFVTSKIFILLNSGSISTMMISTLKDSAIFLSIIIYPLKFIVEMIEENYKNKIIDNGIAPTFNKIINKHTDSILNFNETNFSWGENLTDCICPVILDGWKTEDIIISDTDFCNYDTMPSDENSNLVKEIFSGFNDYLKRKDIIDIVKRDDNMPRLMLSGYMTNYNNDNSKLSISVKKTDFLTVNYLWKYYQNADESKKKEMIKNTFELKTFFPNSLCLHLLIETNDGKVLCSLSSKNKLNDTPYSLAATLGEQIELKDIKEKNGSDFNPDFVECWIKRALMEEFGLGDSFLSEIYNSDSNRVLSVDFEGDRYNFSLLTTTKIKYSFNQFIDLIKKTYQKNEFDLLTYVDFDEIPKVLLSYDVESKASYYIPKYLKEQIDLKEIDSKRINYHESTFIRLLIFHMHKRGIRKTMDIINNCQYV